MSILLRLSVGAFLMAAVVAPIVLGLTARATPPIVPVVTPRASAAQEITSNGFLRVWLQEEATYIITATEREAYAQLTTDEERYRFIEQFWTRRDPTPETVRNEYQEEHYRRIAFANSRFSWERPGWQSDRGRVYILWGPPDQLEEDAGNLREQWRYRYITGIGENVTLDFVDPEESGEYRLMQN